MELQMKPAWRKRQIVVR